MRKAVISSALMSARGLPDLSNRVRLPLGLVLWALAIDCGGSNVPVEVAEALDWWDMESESREEVTEVRDEEEGWGLAFEPARVTILTPRPSLLEYCQLLIWMGEF